MDAKDLDLLGTIGFEGSTKNGLRVHPDGAHILYPMGDRVVVKNTSTGEESFLVGHRNFVSAVGISPCGKYIASGQVDHHGFKARVIIWDYERKAMRNSYEIHKTRVEAVCFSRDSDYLISLGGRDDGKIVVWSVLAGEPVCGSFAGNESSGSAFTIVPTNLHQWKFVTAGDGTLKIWRIDAVARKLSGVEVKVGKIRRAIECVVVDERDENVYCGTSTGDVLKARLNLDGKDGNAPIMIARYCKVPQRASAKAAGPTENLYPGGVKSLLLLRAKPKMILATGRGSVELIEIAEDPIGDSRRIERKLSVIPRIITHRVGNVCASVTSLCMLGEESILVGTVLCEIYEIELSSFRVRLFVSSHAGSIYDLAFPRNRSEIFATAGKNDVRLWTLKRRRELLRISVPNFICSSLTFNRSGETIISEAWNDGVIRGFVSRDGKLAFAIHNAHAKAVSAIAITEDESKLVSGGCDGQVRVWEAKSESRRLLKVLKEHRGPISSLSISRDDQSLISSSMDGTCVVWDLTNCERKYSVMGNTMYTAAVFALNDAQILTCGTDRKVAYWESWDGSLVREIEGSAAGTLNTIDLSPDGLHFVTGASDSTVKLWEYRTAITIRLGRVHAAPITACKFSPDGRHIVTVSADGAIVLWCWKGAVEAEAEASVARRGSACVEMSKDRCCSRAPKDVLARVTKS